ncbi:MAG TPA: glycosyltransferase [Pyrinomonadaceae bacterium]|jgi:glycosyltransferase involved in cell wall biosynthesis|nr:glycosyltransferase [Pyrinomonadaceae bacterium]
MKNYAEEKYADCPQIKQRVKNLRVGKQVIATPRVSVVIPAYNIASFVKETLDSVFAQTYNNFEVILINDGSKDTKDLLAALKPYFDRIVYAEQENLGASQARNTAICLAQGEYLAFLDGDDIWLPNFLLSQVEFLEKKNLDMVYCDAELFGEPLFEGERYTKTSPSHGAVTTETLISAECNVITSGTILKKDWVVRLNMFDTDLPRMQDFDLWYRLAKNGAHIGYQTDVLVRYRVRLNSLSGTNVERSFRNIRALNVIREKYGLSERENLVWSKQMLVYEAEYELEQGKFSLTRGDFLEAQAHIARANKYFRKPKLFLLMTLLKISPKLTLKLFKKFRPAEYSFIAPQKS